MKLICIACCMYEDTGIKAIKITTLLLLMVTEWIMRGRHGKYSYWISNKKSIPFSGNVLLIYFEICRYWHLLIDTLYLCLLSRVNWNKYWKSWVEDADKRGKCIPQAVQLGLHYRYLTPIRICWEIFKFVWRLCFSNLIVIESNS